MATGDLTTLAEVKAYLHIPTGNTANDTLLTALITQVTTRIQNDCGRNFLAADYIEFHNIQRGQTRVVPFNKPINQVYRIAWGSSPAFQVVYNGSAIAAGMTLRPDRKFVLNTLDTSGKHETTFDLATTPYSACSQVVTAINAVSGFVATLYSSIDVPTPWLFPLANMTLKSYNSFFTQSMGFASVDVFTYEVDPVYGTIGFQPFTLADFVFTGRNPAGNFGWPTMYNGLCVQYNGGFATIPQDINLLCQQVVADIYNQSLRDNNLTAENLGDAGYTMADMMLRRTYYADMLAPYRRVGMMGGMS